MKENMVESIEHARIEFDDILGFTTCLSRKKIRDYIQFNKELVILFPKYALQSKLRIQAAEEWLNKH